MNQIIFKKLDYVVKGENGVDEIKSSEAILPTKTTDNGTILDVYSTRLTQEADNSGKLVLTYHTDLSVEIPKGYVGILMMRSDAYKRSLSLTNAVEIINPDYDGEITAKFKVTTDAVPTIYAQGEAFAQLIIVPIVNIDPVFLEDTPQSPGVEHMPENNEAI